MAEIIAIANLKGGTGKTTTVFSVGMGLSSKGKRVLLIDLDHQATLTRSLCRHNEPIKLEKGIASVFCDTSVDIRNCIVNVGENMDLVPSTFELAYLEKDTLFRALVKNGLGSALKLVKDDYDFILIDCPPVPSVLVNNALSAADGVIVPTSANPSAYHALMEQMKEVRDVKENFNPSLEMYGVLVTMFDTDSAIDKDGLKRLESEYNVIDVIPRDDIKSVMIAYDWFAERVLTGTYRGELL